ncbi:hypothetical protein ACVIYL_004831 [Bradyrhizobium sp. USDA 3315]
MHCPAGLEDRKALLLDLHVLARSWIAARARLSIADRKYSEAPQLNPVTAREPLNDLIEDCAHNIVDHALIKMRAAVGDTLNECGPDHRRRCCHLGSCHLLESVGNCQDSFMLALMKDCHRRMNNQLWLAASTGPPGLLLQASAGVLSKLNLLATRPCCPWLGAMSKSWTGSIDELSKGLESHAALDCTLFGRRGRSPDHVKAVQRSRMSQLLVSRRPNPAISEKQSRFGALHTIRLDIVVCHCARCAPVPLRMVSDRSSQSS